MCGLAGLIDLGGRASDGDLGVCASRMAETLVHRGPDDAGLFVDEHAGVAMAFRRLAVMDLSPAGHQPMTSQDGRITVTFNGEIYNHDELRASLVSGGWCPRGDGDTEVLVEAIARWGLQGTVQRAEGMFAVASWDRRRRRLELARDRLGEKPLYVGRLGRRVLWASELRAIEAVAPDLMIDRVSMRAYLRYGYVPGARSMWEGIASVEPGTLWLLEVGRGETEARRVRYWSLADTVRRARATPVVAGREERLDLLEDAVLRAVGSRLDADVPLGALLSGGIDSSLVVGALARIGRTPQTFTVGFGGHAVDEALHAAAVARAYGTRHTEIPLDVRDAIDLVPSLAEVFDQPFGDPSALPSVLLARFVRRHVTVVLGGDGGDELFAGYERYRWVRSLRSIQQRGGPLVAPLARLGASGVVPWGLVVAAAGRVRPLPGRASPEAAHRAARLLARRDLERFGVDLVAHWRDAEHLVPGVAEPSVLGGWLAERGDGLDEVQRLMLADTAVYLPDDLLVKVDRTTMAVGLEGRLPFLDPALLEFAWRLPDEDRSPDGGGKQLPKALLARWLPEALVTRPKQGFEIPLDEWLRGPLSEWAGDLLTSDAFDRLGLAGRDEVLRRWDDHRRGRRRHGYEIWSLLQLLAWADRGQRGR